MSLLTVDDVRARISTSLKDDVLQSLINSEEAALVRRLGPVYAPATPIVENIAGVGGSVFLRRRISTVSSVTEAIGAGDTPAAVAASGYKIWADEGRLERLPRGAKWGEDVAVTYLPMDDRAEWRGALILLVTMALDFKALQSESVGGEYFYQQRPNPELDRVRVLRRLGFLNI